MSDQHAQLRQFDGYYRFPAIHGDTVVFACEEDLWTVPTSGGIPRRLTSGLGAAGAPAISPDGKWLAFSGKEEGPLEIWLMPTEGGPPKRLTFLGSNSLVMGWAPDGRIMFSSDWKQPFMRYTRAFSVSTDGDEPREVLADPLEDEIGAGSPHQAPITWLKALSYSSRVLVSTGMKATRGR